MMRLVLTDYEQELASGVINAVCAASRDASAGEARRTKIAEQGSTIFVLINLHVGAVCDQRYGSSDFLQEKSMTLILETPSANETCPSLLAASVSANERPLELQELLTRARSAVSGSDERFVRSSIFGDTVINHVAKTVTRDGRPLYLSPTEFRILELLAARPHAVVSKQSLLANIGRAHRDRQSNVIEAHVSNLRRKLAQTGGDVLFITVRGGGYKFIAQQSEAMLPQKEDDDANQNRSDPGAIGENTPLLSQCDRVKMFCGKG